MRSAWERRAFAGAPAEVRYGLSMVTAWLPLPADTAEVMLPRGRGARPATIDQIEASEDPAVVIPMTY